MQDPARPAQLAGDALAFGAKACGAWPRPGIRRAACPTCGAAMYSQGCPAHQWLWPHRLPVGQCAAALPQHHPGAVLPCRPTTVWPGHDYHGRSHSTIGAEKAGNARVAGRSEAEFVALMEGLHPPAPERIDEAVPANRCSGLRHDAGATGQPTRRADQGWPVMCPRAGLAMGAGGRCGAGRCAQRRRARLGGRGARRCGRGLEAMARDGDEPGFRCADPRGRAPGRKAVLLCRSGVRSMAAAQAPPPWGWRPGNVLRASRATPTSRRIAACGRVALFMACPGGRDDRACKRALQRRDAQLLARVNLVRVRQHGPVGFKDARVLVGVAVVFSQWPRGCRHAPRRGTGPRVRERSRP